MRLFTYAHTHTHTIEYHYSAMKRMKTLPSAATQMDLEGIMFSEVSQRK